MTRKHNSKGRSKGDGRYLRITHFMMDTPAWRSLSPYERALYLEMAKIYNGSNNGYLGLGVRRAAELCNMSVNKATACCRVLVERGFIEIAQPSAFSRKDRTATEWRLTQYACDRTKCASTSAFQHWRPETSLVQGKPSRPKPATDSASTVVAKAA